MHWYLDVLKKYAVLTGRASRKEYWMFFLFQVIICFLLGGVEEFWGLNPNSKVDEIPFWVAIYILATFLPMLTVAVRRLQDQERSGWWMLICAVPSIGGILFSILMVLPGTKGDNRFGSDPKLEIKTLH